MEIQKKFEEAKYLIDKSSRVLLTMHERMDGDDGGSLLAFARLLKGQGKSVFCAIKKGVPPSLRFLPGSELISDDINSPGFDLLITFGCSDLKRTGSEKIQALKIPIINIDHHPDNQQFGEVNLVDEQKSSVAELVYDFFSHHKLYIDKEIATCLLTGIITDTGSFMHSNTQASTLKVASELMKKGAVAEKIVGWTFKNKNSQVLKAWGKALSNLHFDSKTKIIYSIISENDLAELGELPQSAFEGLAETLNTFPDAKFAMLLRQEGNIIKGSLRTDPNKNADVSQIAKIFGGGGHKMAAGFSVSGTLVKDEKNKWRVV